MPESIEKNNTREKLQRNIDSYWEAKQNLALSPTGGTESGLELGQILDQIETLIEEIQPGSSAGLSQFETVGEMEEGGNLEEVAEAAADRENAVMKVAEEVLGSA